MSWFEIVAILCAGVAAGTINTIVGSGSLITFPTLVFFGFPPLTANMSNNVGLLPGGITGAHGYRRELVGQSATLRRLLPASLLGGTVGALLLLVLPESVFGAVVPALILLGVVLVVVGPMVQRRVRERQAEIPDPADEGGQGSRGRGRGWLLPVLIFLAGIYGGYFGAAQGVILVGILGMLMSEDVQVLNALKNVMGLVVNSVAAIVFVVARGDLINWWVAAIIGMGTLLGGVIGARVGRRLPSIWLRGVIVVVGLVAVVHMTVFS